MKRVIARNIIFSWGARAAEAIAGFFVAPFLVHKLGHTSYGLWMVIASLTGYFGLLDLGVQASVGRFIAFYRAKNDEQGINRAASTASVFLLGVGLVAFLGMIGFQLLFFHIFTVSPEAVSSTRWALFLIGLNLALMFPASIFDATLWGCQRFDILGSVEAFLAFLRAGLTFWLIGSGHGLVALALITLGATTAGAIAKGIMSFWEEPRLRLKIEHVKWDELPAILGYSFWKMLMGVGRISTTRINPFIIGAWLSMALVTPYALAARLMAYVTELFLAARTVLVPIATAFEAQERHEWKQRLMIEGGKYNSIFALFFVILLSFLGNRFLTLWIGRDLADSSSPLLIILIIGECLAMSQSATTSMILGMARHRILAALAVIEVVATIGLALALAGPYGLIGVCVAQAIPAALCRGIVQLVYACRLIHLPVRRYISKTALPALAACALPSASLGGLVEWHLPVNWLQLSAYFAAYSLLFAISWVLICEREVVISVCRILVQKTFGVTITWKTAKNSESQKELGDSTVASGFCPGSAKP
jgi:O-antigen/teichoic acid export membrane protein